MTPERQVTAWTTGLVLARLAEHAGLTQAQLAAATGISQATVSRVQRGTIELTVATLRTLAAALGVKPGAILQRTAQAQDSALDMARRIYDKPKMLWHQTPNGIRGLVVFAVAVEFPRRRES